MYVNYKNLLKKELVLLPETMAEYERIKRFSEHAKDKNEILRFPFTTSEQFEQAKILVNIQKKVHNGAVVLYVNTFTKKWLLLTGMTFPNDEAFLQTLIRYGITLEQCREFSEQIESFLMRVNEIKQPNEELELLLTNTLTIQNLQKIKQYYSLKNMEVIINKILEISYIHPELLKKQKEK